MPVSRYLCIFINVGLGEARFSGRLLNTNIFKSSGKYIPTPGTKKIRVIASGGGGGGGGVPETTENQQATAGAGLSGAFIEAFFEVDNDFEVNVIIGAAGKGGGAGRNSGSEGGTTYFGSLITAPGGTYWFVQYGMTTQPYQFTKGSIFHLMEPDINQEIYGLPGYLSAIPSALLNESATLFRRKYYINGSHAGFIMYMTDAAQNQEDVNNLRNAMKSAKGPGNFRNLFMYSPNGKKDGLQIIPLSEVAAKDEFLNIKNVSRDDMMAAHRVPPQMMGIMPNNVGGFGDVEKASRVFVRNELTPLQKRLQELNDWLGEEVIKFTPYILSEE